ncbi:LCM-domain-containing protein [Aulographum hederae CBS 113979]|uniref:Leucine carboxyl methyltransferase 1 n=1 Tax=Aulographum hederae CBS 113979 TaxID=1176131 RepID=A0A6G1GU74_9PEZI|nr:LCM-domain-containing protein [Aulographum hederae CBS 113979]
MSAQQIPNLNTLKGALRPGGRVRGGRLRDQTTSHEAGEDGEARKDKVVQQTDGDASMSRMSAVDLGYLEDPFARPFIQVGTYVRSSAIDLLIGKFLATDANKPKQIISLGAGSDTRFFRLVSQSPSLPIVYHELDFPINTAQKVAAIRRTPRLLSTIQSSLSQPEDLKISSSGDSLTSPTYNIHPLDLRVLAGDQSAPKLPELPNLSSSIPTLLLSECCLIYLSPTHADNILQTLTQRIIAPSTPVSLILYEPIRPHDSFGKVMIANLAARGIHLQTLQKYSSLFRQKTRLKNAGFVGGQGAADIDFCWERWIPDDEKERVAGLEMLDEVEEWRLLAQHYCVAWGWRNGEGSQDEDVFSRAWAGMESQRNDEGEDDG